MKVIFNYATRQFEPMEPSMRERFALGSKDPAPEVKTDGEFAGAFMNAFPGSNTSFLQAVEDGFQGTLEDFLKLQSIPQSDRPITGELDIREQDMKAIEGQTAYAGLLKNLLKLSDEAAEAIAKTKTSEGGPAFYKLKRKDPENYTEAEKLFEKEVTEKFKAIADDPLYKDLIPKKFRNIKSITELSQSDLDKISKDFLDFQFKPITDEKGLGPYSTLKKGQQGSVRSLFKARADAKKRPDFFSLNIAGDTFNFPYMKGIDPKTVKNFEKVYPTLKKIEANPTAENYYKQIGKKKTGERILLNDIQAYLTGVDNRSRSVFNSPKQIQFLKSLDLENKLSKETIELLKTQKGQTAANIFKQAKATKAAQKVNLEQLNTESIKRINEIYTFDPDSTAKEVIDQYYGNSIKNKSKAEQAQMLKDLRNDVITYYKIISKTRIKPKGVRLPSKEKVDDILTSIMEGKGKDSFDIHGGYLRNIYSDIADSVTKPGFKYDKKVSALSKQFPGQHVDHTAGLSAVHEAAPGYVEAVQIIPKKINKEKGRLLDRAATKIIDDFFTNTPNKIRKIGDKEYKTFQEKVDAFNTLSKQFANANGIDTPFLRFGEPGKGPSPKETVKYFSEFSEGAQKNMMEVWNNHGFVIYTNSRPMGSSFWTKTKPMKNMGGLIDRVNFSEGTKIDQFLAANESSPLESEGTIDQALAALNSSEVRKQFLYDTSPIGKLDKNIFGKDGDRNLMQQFNTQFLDPRSYPYYAQKTIRGAANIPELAVRFPLAAAYLFGKGSLALQTGDLSKFSMEDLRTAMEILEPKFTKLALDGTLGDVLGLSPEAIQAVEEKRAPSQKATGDLLQFGAEAVGPATPYFAVKALQKIFPKLPQQIKDLVGSTTAIDKVNKEIEKRTAVEGVDQTRRDIILATGAGGAVALLKLLGLDNLFKAAPKAVKAAPEIVTKGGTPKYFFDFVGLIKSKGKDITDKASTLERQKVYDYNGYTMYEDISTGKITIRKDTEGGGTYSIGDGEYESYDGIIRKEEINYEPPETILDDAGKPKEVPDTYDEATLLPDVDGSDGDIAAGLDSIDEILELLAKDGKTYSRAELEEMGFNLDTKEGVDAFLKKNPNYKFKTEKAGGGRVGFEKGGPGGLPKLLQPKDMDLKTDPVGIIMEGKPKSSEFDNVFLDVIEEIKEKANEPIKYTDGTTYYPEIKAFFDKDFNEVPGPSKGAIPLKERSQEVIPQKRLEAAGGGILKMAGDDSGPPPKSGPTPHGLPYVVKNVRPIKERK